jgi:hypothetical protein
MTTITLTDLRGALRGQNKADEAIFWFCHAWHSGPSSDLYRAMVELDFHPRLHTQKQIVNDPEILYCFDVLGKLVGPLVEHSMSRIRLGDVKENDVLTHTNPQTFVCIEAGWPCRVYRHHGCLGVACAEGPSGASFHLLVPDPEGYVRGFVR